uniref:Tc1-like transposase DDE domain-containing protein n=1 Tax=Oncorhynchus mykiss TaxID=8022 RepID=A0A8K9V481_ONCMY
MQSLRKTSFGDLHVPTYRIFFLHSAWFFRRVIISVLKEGKRLGSATILDIVHTHVLNELTKVSLHILQADFSRNPARVSRNLKSYYSALRKYSAPLNFATFCHISGFKHKDIKLYFFVKNQQQVGHNHEVERHLLDISNFFNKSKTEKLGVQNSGQRDWVASVRRLGLGRRWTFQQDNDPKHTSRSTQKWFCDNKINVPPWPSQSPDLNPIQNPWAELKRAVDKRKPKNVKDLERICIEEWSKIPPKCVP